MRALVVAVLLVSGAGCEGPLFISRFENPTDEGREVALTRGTLDIAFAEQYEVTVLAVNEGHGDARVEHANVQIWLGGSDQGLPFYTFSVPVGARIVSGFEGAIELLVLPQQALQAILLRRFLDYHSPSDIPVAEIVPYRDILTLHVQLLGEGVGEDAQATLALEICYGCLVSCPPESGGPGGPLCESVTPPDSVPQVLGQDEPIDCRLCTPLYDADFCRALCL